METLKVSSKSNPLAIAIALMAWLIAPAPTACISTTDFSLNTLANAPATLLGFDLLLLN